MMMRGIYRQTRMMGFSTVVTRPDLVSSEWLSKNLQKVKILDGSYYLDKNRKPAEGESACVCVEVTYEFVWTMVFGLFAPSPLLQIAPPLPQLSLSPLIKL